MENYKNLKKNTKIGLIISLVLIVVGLIATFISLIAHVSRINDNLSPAINDLVNIVIYLCVLYYALFGYKKPHGNLLKTMFLIFAIGLVAQSIVPKIGSNNSSFIVSFCNGVSAVIISYIAGRLNRIEKNQKLLVIVGVLLVISCCLAISSLSFDARRLINICEPIIVNAGLGFAYVARYEEHKEAGLEDK